MIKKAEVNETISIGIADNHLLFRQGLIAMLNTNSSFRIIFDVHNTADLLDHLKINAPEIILFDNHLPGLNYSNLIERINDEFPGTKVIVLAAQFIVVDMVECIGRGARAFLTKDCSIKKLEQVIIRVFTLGSHYDDDVILTISRYTKKKSLIRIEPIEQINQMDIKIIELIGLDKNNHEIAHIVSKSVRTVEGYRSRILAKTGLKSFTSVIPWAIQHRLISGNSDVKSQ